ncbi:MAG: SDR family oxidoreductase [Gammaproteobacteria bacterium]
MQRVKNKIALVTGAARGIGKETAKLLAREGAFVIVTDILDEEGRAFTESLGQSAAYHSLNVSKEQEWIKISDFIKDQYGYVDILFNNAGITGLEGDWGPQNPEHTSLESWHHIHAVNLDGVFFGCKYGIQLMKAKGGSIINMSSRSGVVGIPNACSYASSKAAIRNHTKTVALYCAEQGYPIRCNAVEPAAILTPLWDAMLGADAATREQAIQNISAGIPLRHMGEPIDVAYAVLYLASDESKYITGADFVIDGGILAGSAASPHKK